MVLDDASGAVEVSIFNEVFERHRAIIREDELLVLQVKVSKDDYSGGQRVVAERVLDLVLARQEFGKRFRIRLNGLADGIKLKSALESHVIGAAAGVTLAESSSLPVVVEFANGDARCSVELGAPWRVKPRDELFQLVQQQLHPIEVVVEY